MYQFFFFLKFPTNLCEFIRYRDGNMQERLCPDGMVFNDYSSDQEKCDLPYNIDCSKRPKLRKFFTKKKNCFQINQKAFDKKQAVVTTNTSKHYPTAW